MSDYLQSSLIMGLGRCLFLLVFLAIVIAPGEAQVEGGQQIPAGPEPDSTGMALPPEIDSPNAANALTPGLDFSPSETPPALPSFLGAGLFLSESAETGRSANSVNSDSLYSTPRVSGKLDLLKVWRRSVTELNYIGGGIFYPSGVQPVQQLTAVQQFPMGRRELTLSDSLGYFYGGSFGAASFGGGGLFNLLSTSPGSGGQVGPDLTNFSGESTFGGIGQGSHITNVAQAVLRDALTRRTSISLSGSYGISNYGGGTLSLINSRQFSVSASYHHQLSRRSSVSVLYGYRAFTYPGSATNITDNLVHLSYQRIFSSRMRISVGVGPEFTNLTSVEASVPPQVLTKETNQIHASVFATLSYSWGRTAFAFSYQRLTTGGSGFSAGANSDIAHGSASHHLFRAWQGSVDSGYARLAQIASTTSIAASSYHYWYAGAAARRSLPHGLGFFASYQYNKENSRNLQCAVSNACSVGRNIFLVGLSWQARPIRLDSGGGGDIAPDAADLSPADPSGHQ